MSQARLARLESVFHAVRELPPGERSAYLDRTCGDDEELRREVESLLRHASGDDLRTAGGLEAAAAMAWRTDDTVHTGQTLGPYRLGPVIGVGGMGAVYRARDTKLQRDIAVKILPRAFADHPERLARFDREARALAALNHPHIAQIYGVEEAALPDGRGVLRGLILELVDGETLAERLQRGRPSLAESLRFAIEIAAALEAAHDRGIVHRDLKPANVKVTTAGVIKVLDFGLAKTIGAEATDTALATSHGAVLGTPAYMSPEQARGEVSTRGRTSGRSAACCSNC